MKRHLFVPLALAGLFALAATRFTARSATLTENFAANPLQNGWNMFGDTNLFHWNPANQDLEVTWDSTQPNSYFYRSLGTVLAMEDDFSVEFDLRLDDIADTGFEIAVGLNHFSDATNPLFLRGGTNDYFPNFAEFDYFSAYVSLDATLSDTNSQLSFYYDNLPLNNGTTYHIILTHAGGQPFLAGTILTDSQVYSTLPIPYIGPVNDFRLDTLSISSYSDAGQDPDYAGSVLAHGVVANFVVTLPPPPVQNLGGSLTNGLWAATFICRTNWLYSLERSPDLQNWTTVNPDNAGNGATLVLVDPAPPAASAFYRIRAERL
jgi:hypothetical protein